MFGKCLKIAGGWINEGGGTITISIREKIRRGRMNEGGALTVDYGNTK